jgi:hypothetical protein
MWPRWWSQIRARLIHKTDDADNPGGLATGIREKQKELAARLKILGIEVDIMTESHDDANKY